MNGLHQENDKGCPERFHDGFWVFVFLLWQLTASIGTQSSTSTHLHAVAGQELGYFSGCLATLQQLGAKDDALLSEKATRLIAEASELVHTFPRDDPQDSELQSKMDAIRAKFKLLLATIGVLQDFFPKQQSTGSIEF